jgi:hypothetical protein
VAPAEARTAELIVVGGHRGFDSVEQPLDVTNTVRSSTWRRSEHQRDKRRSGLDAKYGALAVAAPRRTRRRHSSASQNFPREHINGTPTPNVNPYTVIDSIDRP